MLDEKGNEKRFFIKSMLLGILSIGALYVSSKIPSAPKNQLGLSNPNSNNTFGKANIANTYGNSSYGGKKNA